MGHARIQQGLETGQRLGFIGLKFPPEFGELGGVWPLARGAFDEPAAGEVRIVEWTVLQFDRDLH
ncbi:MAG: hypothetical protein CMC97_06665 [Flavobacteriales bacterium]|nr:hypothetical protein [Flavobacteriales bacterium]